MQTQHTLSPAAGIRPASYPKRTGVQQAEHRIGNVIRALEQDERDAADRGKTRLARKAGLKRAGAALALAAVEELLRNYEGRE